MKLRAITLNNVRRFTAPTGLTGIGDGLNVLCEPNEHGKSTLFDAVQALFFKAHGANDKEIKALKPHAGGAPEVTVEVETDAGTFTIAKRWTSRPAATVRQAGRLVAQADEAEAWIARLVGGTSGGPSGLVWVRQGMTGLTGGSNREQAAALEARRDLMSSVSEEVEAMTGGRRMDMALARCREELSVLATATGREKTGGPWKAASDRVEALRLRRAELSTTAAALHDALDRRKRKRRELAEIEAPDAVTARKKRLDDATKAHTMAERHAESVEVEARKVTTARMAVTAAQSRLEALRVALAERDEAAGLATGAAAAKAAAQADHAAARTALTAAETTLDQAKAALRQAEENHRRAGRQQAAREGAQRRAELVQSIAEAEAARKLREEAEAAARTGPDQAALRRLETLSMALATARATRDAMATQLVVTYAAGRDGAVMLDGAALDGGTPYPIPRGARLAIDGLGEIEIRPGAGAQDDDAVERAEQALAKELDRLGLPDLAAARTAAEARTRAAAQAREAQARFEALAPAGIEKLREVLARIPEAEEDAEPLDPAATEASLGAAGSAMTAAQSTQASAAEAMAKAREALARTDAAECGARERLGRAETALAALGDATVAALDAAMRQAVQELEAAEAIHAEKLRAAPDLAAAEATLRRARSVDEAARADIARLRPEIATLDERIARGSGEAVEERLAECEQELAAAEAELARYAHEVAVLRRLEAALTHARTEARERYFAPVAAELKPLLQLLWPDAELTWTQDTLLPEALTRNGQAEPIDILSGGTQEQVALLVRLAFARMLAKDGRHAPVLLDDALVFTDDDRIERMFDALHRQAGDLQIIVFTCRQRAFRELGGQTLRLAARESVEPVA
ncbi:AAA family ATPase [Oceaniglobus roseus]|uniref:AAA family ATPase n=1 Tax=Oceaniglobus roseus TaxID=1737570 RepID=UPI000C7E999A|nr:chromosome segregation protein SMC [Kandeliimicrobium roseum]